MCEKSQVVVVVEAETKQQELFCRRDVSPSESGNRDGFGRMTCVAVILERTPQWMQ